MKIERVTLRQIGMPLVHFFETSFSRTTERHMILVEVQSGGISGWGEVTAGENPFYNEEWTPLKRREILFEEPQLDKNDPWQFDNFRVY